VLLNSHGHGPRQATSLLFSGTFQPFNTPHWPIPRESPGLTTAVANLRQRAGGPHAVDRALQALSSLAPLVRSPRETKRLLNLYRMLRSTQDLSDASRFLGTDGADGKFQALVMLLGLLSASRRLLGQILFALPNPEQELLGDICHRAAQGTWGSSWTGFNRVASVNVGGMTCATGFGARSCGVGATGRACSATVRARERAGPSDI
jgi:hypothetical protein